MLQGNLFQDFGSWLDGTGPYASVVLASRLRISRNILGYPFSHWSDPGQQKEIAQIIARAVSYSRFFKNTLNINLNQITKTKRNFLAERYLISPKKSDADDYRQLFVRSGETLSLLINEEDHLRLQGLLSGLQLRETWNVLSKVMEDLASRLEFCYSPTWGYVAAAPANAHTGLRASIIVLLPGLTLSRTLGSVFSFLKTEGLVVRSFRGKDTNPAAGIFQISNLLSEGTEPDIISKLERAAKKIISAENQETQRLLTKNRLLAEDKIWRSLGLLRNSRLLSLDECLECLAMARLGINIGLLPELEYKNINKLLISIQPAHLKTLFIKDLDVATADAGRARLMRRIFN